MTIDMKTNRSLLLSFVLLLAAAGSTFAQWSVGVRSGGYAGTITRPDLVTNFTPDFKWSPGISAAVFAEREFSNGMAIRPEIMYQQKGFMVREGTSIKVGNFPVKLGVSSAYKVSYVEAPVLLKLSAGNELAKVYLIAGPSVGYAVDAQLVTRPQAVIELRPIRTNIPINTLGYNLFEFSGIAGAGLSLKAGAGEIMIEGRYQHGISRLIDVPLVRANVRNQGASVSLGYKIPF